MDLTFSAWQPFLPPTPAVAFLEDPVRVLPGGGVVFQPDVPLHEAGRPEFVLGQSRWKNGGKLSHKTLFLHHRANKPLLGGSDKLTGVSSLYL